MASDRNSLYAELEPYQSGWLDVSNLHRIYYEQCGNPAGVPVVFLHGGPGSGCNPIQRRFFDPAHYRIILFDQRGCGRSEPPGEIEHNTTQDLVNDIEAIRSHLAISNWLVFGGSWGSTLALMYALAHQNQVTGLILRGIFLSRPEELDWFLYKVRNFFPEAWENLTSPLAPAERKVIMEAYRKRIYSDDASLNVISARTWNAYESSIMALSAAPSSGTPVPDNIQLARARVQIHYLINRCFIDGQALLREVSRLHNIPTTIVQGRYDMVCPPVSAWELARAMPHAKLVMIPDAGHSAMESGTCAALVEATEAFKRSPHP